MGNKVCGCKDGKEPHTPEIFKGAQKKLDDGPIRAPSVGTRQEIRSMPKAEQTRWARAVLRMMQNEAGKPESSEYFRLAAYHGWPMDYCVHGQETFPGWHRVYMCEFERALKEADRALGGDGKLTMPYWDWLVTTINGEQFPHIIKEYFAEMPSDLVSQDVPIKQYGYQFVYPESRIAWNLANAQLDVGVGLALRQFEHYMAASTRWRGNSVETPHNSVHVAVGFPMTSVSFAAFHPIFFLHHCNVDRVYEKYLQLNPDSKAEFQSYQEMLHDQHGEVNRYKAPLQPFKHPITGSDMYPEDTFDTTALGYVYADLPPSPPDELREVPTFVVFNPVDGLEFAKQGFELHVFITRIGPDTDRWTAPDDITDDWSSIPSYAGWGAIFGGKGRGCANCEEREPFMVVIDVSAFLARHKLRRSSAVIHTVCINQEQRIVPMPDALPKPEFRGSFFEGPMSEVLARGCTGADVEALQSYLLQYEYYGGPVDGVYGASTELAVRKFQEWNKLKVDGACGPETKALVMDPRWDANRFTYEDHDVATYAPGEKIRVHVGICPGYLSREAVVREVMQACAVWRDATKVDFVQAMDASQSDVRVEWQDRSPDGLFFFDGKGGALAYTGTSQVTLDLAEYWVLQGAASDPRRSRPIELLPVVIHEFGHVLGLVHSDNPRDIMAPYYVPGRIQLAAGDVERAAALYA